MISCIGGAYQINVPNTNLNVSVFSRMLPNHIVFIIYTQSEYHLVIVNRNVFCIVLFSLSL